MGKPTANMLPLTNQFHIKISQQLGVSLNRRQLPFPILTAVGELL